MANTTTTTSYHLTPPPTRNNELSAASNSNNSPISQRSPPSPRTQSKSILTIALQKAQSAVEFDAANDFTAALEAYRETVELLSQVVDKAVNDVERRRLQLIELGVEFNELKHSTYVDRIRLLSAISPDSSMDGTDGIESDQTSTENNNDGNKQNENSTDLITSISLSPITVSNSQHIEESDGLTESDDQKTETSSIKNAGPTRVFIPPPPPNIAPPTTSVNSRSFSTNLISDDEDDKESIRSIPPNTTNVANNITNTATASNISSSSPYFVENFHKNNKKSFAKSRRPAPLSSIQYNSPTAVTTPVTSTVNYNTYVTPRRTASNPGNGLRKNNSLRFFNNYSQSLPSQSFTQYLSQIPGTPTTPWTSNSLPSPLSSPRSSVTPTGTFKNDITSKNMDLGYASCLLNPLYNPLFYEKEEETSNMVEYGLPELPPNDIHLKPFWLMRLLERTMTTGGYLTPKLYIPRHLWLQGHAKLNALETKISSCDVVLNCLLRLTKSSINDMDALAKELEGIDLILDGLQNSLARKISYIESTTGKGKQSASSLMSWGSKLSRGLDRMGMSNAMIRSEEANGYVDVLLKLFQNVDIVGQ
ncbi:5032_t:CDS:2 [Entrophospora sp. SA101]|nr:5032_t:CDS:2 [Entrophospora sp. SA101]